MFIASCNKYSFEAIKLTSDLQRAIGEIAHNLLYTELDLLQPELRALKQTKANVIQLSKANLPLSKASKAFSFRTAKSILKPVVRILDGSKICARARKLPEGNASQDSGRPATE